MAHKLHVLVQLNTHAESASVEVRGCLTGSTLDELLAVLRRTEAAALGASVSVNLRRAQHIDGHALTVLLQDRPAPKKDGRTGAGSNSVTISYPEELPRCLSSAPLTNPVAAARAFLDRDAAVLAGRTRPPSGEQGRLIREHIKK